MDPCIRTIWQRRCQIALLLVAGFAFELASINDVSAQQRAGRRRGERPKAERVSISGLLHSMVLQKGLIRVVTGENQNWQVQLIETTDVRVNGEGGPELLRPGLFVRFYGRLTRTGKGVEPIKELTVVTPDAAFRPSISEEEDEPTEEVAATDDSASDEKPEDGAASSARDSREAADDDPAPGSDTLDGDRSKDRRPRTRRRSRDKKTRVVAAGRYWVSGQLRSMKKGKLVVYAGDKSVRVEVDEKTRVVVEAKDLRLARAGDPIAIHGSYYPDRPGNARAYDVEVTLATKEPPDAATPADGPKKRDSKRGRLKVETKEIDDADL